MHLCAVLTRFGASRLTGECREVVTSGHELGSLSVVHGLDDAPFIELGVVAFVNPSCSRFGLEALGDVNLDIRVGVDT